MSQESSVGQLSVAKRPALTTATAGPLTSVKESASGSSPITPGFLWYVVRKWSKLAIPLGVLTALLASGLVLFLFEPQYRAEVLLQIKKQRVVIATPVDGAVSNDVETQKQLLRSAPVLSKVLAKPEIARLPELRRGDDPKKWIAKRLDIRAVGGSELFTVAYEGPNAESARLIVDAVVNSYFALQTTQNDDQIAKLLNALEGVKQEQIDNVVRLEKSVLETAKKYSGNTALIVSPKRPSLLEISPMVLELQQRLSQVEFDRQMTSMQIKAHEEQGAPQQPLISETDVEDFISDSPEIVELETKILAERKKLITVQPKTVHADRAERAIKEFEDQLQQARPRIRKKLLEDSKNRLAAVERDRLLEMKAVLVEHQLRENLLRSRLDDERRKIEMQTGNQYELEFLSNDLARAKQVADRIEDRIFALTIEYLTPLRPEQVVVLYPAETPRTPIEAYPLKAMGMAGLAGFMVPFAAFVGFELLSRRLYQSNQLQDRSHLPLLAEIAVLPTRPRFSHRGAVRRYRRDRAIFEESVESLRSVLSVSPEWADVQVLAITSAVSGEGKTSLASQLATGWSRHGGAKTLIIDGDVRDPDVYAIFGIANSPGLVDVLRHDCEQDRAIVHWEGQLDILPAGTLMADPHRLFAGNDFAELIERLRTRYDRIVVDVAPLLSASEVLGILKTVDGVLLCARKDHSRAPQVRLARERLEKAGIERVGGVFGGLSSQSYAYQYGDYTG